MLTLALEQSTAEGSLALLQDDNVVAEACWTDSRLRKRQLFELLPAALKDAGTSVPEIDLFAVGLGPGSFSGIRMSYATIQAMTLPAGKDMWGCSSAEVMAWRAARELSEPTVSVVGDARRDRFWIATYHTEDGLPKEVHSPELIPAETLRDRLVQGSAIVTPDWDRIGDKLSLVAGSNGALHQGNFIPTARALAGLVLAKRDAGIPCDAGGPIYMHPAVFVEPRFPRREG